MLVQLMPPREIQSDDPLQVIPVDDEKKEGKTADLEKEKQVTLVAAEALKLHKPNEEQQDVPEERQVIVLPARRTCIQKCCDRFWAIFKSRSS